MKLEMEAKQKRGVMGSPSAPVSPQCDNNAANRLYGGRSYGVSLRSVRGNFVPPIKSSGSNIGNMTSRLAGNKGDDSLDESTKKCLEILCGPDGKLPEKLRNLEPRLIEHDPTGHWDDIAGLEHAKSCVNEMVVFPLLRPDLFMGCRSPGRGATNRPQELDEAARRRLTKRLYIPLPSSEARAWIVRSLLENDGLFKLSNEEMDIICNLTEGYSGSDMKNLVKDASLGPIREQIRQGAKVVNLEKEKIRPVTLQDFKNSLQEVRPSVSPNELGTYEQWNKQFGSLAK